VRLASLGLVLVAELLTLMPSRAAADSDTVVVVVNAANTTPEVTIHDLRLLYGLYRRVWEGGARVELVVPESGTPAMAFLASRVFRRQNESDVDRHFVQAVFQGRIAQAPVQLSTELALSLVRRELGAIALVLEDEVQSDPGIRVIRIPEVTSSLAVAPSEG